EELRKKRFAEMQKMQKERIQAQQEQEEQVLEQIQALENLVRPRLDKQALERYGNLKTAHPQKAVQALLVCAQIIQSNHTEKVSDEEFKMILVKLEPQKRKTNITRR
ncbi:TPA: hypothetical protein HA265_04025, partial [Candidatus Woesearchaeota archaeon]|nr:hypothetical protein [Candidatus Woesearchaeota archaeon]